jgi:hypothetical protein
MERLNKDVQEVLWSTEPTLEKAFQLASHLEQMCVAPTVPGGVTVHDSIKAHASDVHKLLTNLASKLPTNEGARHRQLASAVVGHARRRRQRISNQSATLLAQGRRAGAKSLLEILRVQMVCT